MPEIQTAKLDTSDVVLEAVQDLHAHEKIVTREALAETTGLKLSIIDDRIKFLVDDGLVMRRQRGVFEPAPIYSPARPVSKTILPDGTVKVEIGDDVITLTPRENRALGDLMSGAGMQYATIESPRVVGNDLWELAWKIRCLERVLRRRREREDKNLALPL
jgi:ribosomal protein S25